jgi:hypothetical protein
MEERDDETKKAFDSSPILGTRTGTRLAMSNPLPEWPPKATDQEREELLSLAVDYALSTSLVLRPQGDPPSTNEAIHAPFSLYPTPFPRHLFATALALQPLYNEVYARVTNDDEFLESVIGGAVAKVDHFQGELWNIYKAVRAEGLAQVRLYVWPLCLVEESFINNRLFI